MVQRNILLVLSLVGLLSVTIPSVTCSSAPTYHIRDKQSGLCLDGTDPLDIQIQEYNSTSLYQRWTVQPATTLGTFSIINEGWGLALNNSFDGRSRNLTLADFSSEDGYQRWFISYDETIVSAADYPATYGLAIFQSAFKEGDSVVLWDHRYLGVKDMFIFIENVD